MNTNEKITVGHVEWCALPDMNLAAIKVCMDSVSQFSSIQAFNIQPFQRDGQPWVSFDLHPMHNDRHTIVHCEEPVVDYRSLKNGTGIARNRYLISTSIQLGTCAWDIELALAERDSTGCPMLLGREAMKDRLIIDPSTRFCCGELSMTPFKHQYRGSINNRTNKPDFRAGNNIAMKVPSQQFDQTVNFYRDILGLQAVDTGVVDAIESVTFQFGDKTLWIDRINGISQAEIWLEVVTDDIKAASEYLSQFDGIRRDEVEPLPEGFKGFWLSNPADIIHLISE